MAGILKLLRTKWYPPGEPTVSFDGQTIIVTGSNTGIGYEAASKFAQLGAQHLILGVRDIKAGESAQHILQHLCTHPKARVEVWQLDLLSYSSVQGFARRVENELDRLDLAILNAGAINVEYKQSEYGWERMLQVNVLSTLLLAIILLPKMRSSRTADRTPTLELVSSGLHYVATLPEGCESDDTAILDALNTQSNFQNGSTQYRRTKLLAQLALDGILQLVRPSATREASDSEATINEEQPDVWVTSVCPGACSSGLGREYDGVAFRIAKAAMGVLLLRTPEEGSRTLVSGAALGAKGHGQFWQHDVIKEPAPILTGEDGAKLKKRVWLEVLDALKKDVPEVEALVR
ncbi:MAG: hypothetical protein M1828_006646 [Chrysothrix sp. TS-e1954]|nr:MAG: hypothetical protein M1828_006646 [Chrysothrix sp. TS-e1954]